MANMQKTKTAMPLQDPAVRNSNFSEVSLGYTYEAAVNEAQRCLNCKNRPCVSGCPVNVEIPNFISLLADGNVKGAYDTIKQRNFLPAVCGRVCPQENQCEKMCVRGRNGEAVAIGRLERFAADWARENGYEPSHEITKEKSGKVAVIGAGPSGLTCAGVLADAGYTVEIFESLNKSGGVLTYGIPEFRLPKEIVRYEVNGLVEKGVIINNDVVVGKTVTIDQLRDMGFDAFFIGSGAGLPSFMGIPGEGLTGVMSANELLTRVNLMEGYKDDTDTPLPVMKRTIVVGGGNVAMDAARVSKRLGSDVTIVYRRDVDQMPARKEEIEHAMEEDIRFYTLHNPVRIIGDEKGRVSRVECISMMLTEPDDSGRRAVKPIEGSEELIEADSVIMAIGTSPNPLLRNSISGIEISRRGGFVVDENMRTSIPYIWAGGDAVTGSATVIEAMGAGQKAAHSIIEYLRSI